VTLSLSLRWDAIKDALFSARPSYVVGYSASPFPFANVHEYFSLYLDCQVKTEVKISTPVRFPPPPDLTGAFFRDFFCLLAKFWLFSGLASPLTLLSALRSKACISPALLKLVYVSSLFRLLDSRAETASLPAWCLLEESYNCWRSSSAALSTNLLFFMFPL